MEFMRILILPLLVLLLSSSSFAITPVGNEPTNKRDCESNGGKWGTFGLIGVERCNLKADDAGKTCLDGSECQSGACIADTDSKIGSEAKGHCYENRIVLGTCLKRVQGGKATPALCVD